MNWLRDLTKAWQDLLDSFSTKGGNILLMFIALGGLMLYVHHLGTDGHVDPSVLSAAHNMMVGFGAALLAVLSGSSSRQQMVDRVEVATKSVAPPPLPPNTTTVETKLTTTESEKTDPPPEPAPNSPSPWVKR